MIWLNKRTGMPNPSFTGTTSSWCFIGVGLLSKNILSTHLFYKVHENNLLMASLCALSHPLTES